MDGLAVSDNACYILVYLIHAGDALVFGEVSTTLLATAVELSEVLIDVR